MTSPLQFESNHAPAWKELEALLDRAEGQPQTRTKGKPKDELDGARLAALYRRVCEHLALAQARAYPIHLTQRLEALTQRAHRLIYRRQTWGLGQLRQLVLIDFPQAVRAHGRYLLAAALLFLVPALAMGVAVWLDPGFVLHLVDAAQVQSFDRMYGDRADSFGRTRGADTDLQMFGYYIMHNTGLGFQCFAAGIFAGVGSAFFLAFNGLFLGAISAYLINAGYATNFCSFVVTHSAFELTAIVLSGAAGLRLGHAWISPGPLKRLEAVKLAARESIVVIYGAAGMLFIAAALEAFWSSSRWVEPAVKYAFGAACWFFVFTYLGWQGRPAAAPAPATKDTNAG